MAPEPHPPLFAYLPPKIHSRLGAAGSGVWSGIVGMGSGACAFALASAAARNLFFSSLASSFAPPRDALFETSPCRGARRVVDVFASRRAVEIDPRRITQDRLAIRRSQLPHRQHGARIGRTPTKLFDHRLLRAVRERADFVRFDRKRLRPPGAQKVDFLAAFFVAARFLSDLSVMFGASVVMEPSLAIWPSLLKTEK
jgi:hypothetical protein